MARKAGMARREFLTRATTTAVVAAEFPAPAAAEADSEEPADLPATDLEELERAVGAVVAGKRIGRPVFVRYTLPGAGKGRQRVARLARMMQAGGQWMGQAPARLYAVGSLKDGAISLTVQFRDGASALLSVVRGKGHGDGVDLLVIGNHGALHYDSATAAGWDATATHRRGEPDAKLVAAIERALRSGRPETLDREG
jgi:hypothetical protein